ncbi:MAG: hypothetical protein GQ578_08485 [Desulfuromonadaceae bacterium]|nr:hypothetical protein [Desulfuromonadaceae bacterium]
MLTTGAGGTPLSENAEVQVAVSRDTWVSSFHDEQNANLGGANRLKPRASRNSASSISARNSFGVGSLPVPPCISTAVPKHR